MAMAFAYDVPAAYDAVDDAEILARVADTLADAGHTWLGGPAEVSVGPVHKQGGRKLYVNATPDPSALLAAFNVRAKSKQLEQLDTLRDRLAAYLANQSPTQAQSVAAIKDLIRALNALNRLM